jgi:prepilin-type N-terminal cleavage/methylation domain-containing protein
MVRDLGLDLRSDAGVTLTELLVVLTIVAVLAACAVPGFRVYGERQALMRSTDRLVAEIQRARFNALAEGRTWRIVFEPPYYRIGPAVGPLTSYRLERASFGAPTTRDYAGNPIPADGVRFDSDRLSFSAMGSCNAGTVFVQAGGRACAISLQPACGLAVLRIYDGGWRAARN